MQLGLNLGYWGAGNDADNLALAQEADRLGYAVVWAAEAYGSDAATVLAWVAAQTERIDVGSGDLPDPGPHPGDDRDDRGHPRHAVRRPVPARPRRLRARRSPRAGTASGSTSRWPAPASTSTIVRMALRRETVSLRRASTTRCRCPTGPGKALKLTVHPAREHIPIYLAAVGPKNLELTGEIADGWLAIFFAPEHAGELLAHVAAGRAEAGHGRWTASTSCRRCRSSSATTSSACADPVRRYAALYVGGMGSREQNFYNQLAVRMGYERRGRARSRTCTWPATTRDAAAAVPFELHRPRPSLLGPPERIADRLAAYADAGVTTLPRRVVRRRPSRSGSRRCGPWPRCSTSPGWGTEVDVLVRGDRPRASCRGSPSSCRSPPPRTCASSRRSLGWADPGAAFTAVIQLGTMAAVAHLLRQDMWRIVVVPGRARSSPRAARRRSTRGWAGTSSSARSRSAFSALPSRTRSRPGRATCGHRRSDDPLRPRAVRRRPGRPRSASRSAT